MRKSSKSNLLSKALFERNFENTYIPLVVLANPKTYLNMRFAPKDVKETVIRADQVINKIKKVNDASNENDMTEKEMQEIASFFLNANKSGKSDYAEKYRKLIEENEKKSASELETGHKQENTEEKSEVQEPEEQPAERLCPKCGKKLVLRTASKGNFAGKQFYGCSGFPNCRYIENMN